MIESKDSDVVYWKIKDDQPCVFLEHHGHAEVKKSENEVSEQSAARDHIKESGFSAFRTCCYSLEFTWIKNQKARYKRRNDTVLNYADLLIEEEQFRKLRFWGLDFRTTSGENAGVFEDGKGEAKSSGVGDGLGSIVRETLDLLDAAPEVFDGFVGVPSVGKGITVAFDLLGLDGKRRST